jgi:protein kinase-like protein/SH3 domain-containing protein
MNDLVGTQLGQYYILEVIRHGGMATVYKAYQPALERNVAVKVLLQTHDSAFAARFKREARAIARLQHPYILPIYDYGEQNGLLYLVLRHVEHGATLGDLLSAPMEPATALELIGHVLGALDYAHRCGVIHRDIKPANILMLSPTWPMLADFGIAKLANESGTLTQGGVLLGTAAYMAPEQALGHPADVRTDLYAVGVVLYELLTGHLPFTAADPVSVLHQHAYEPLPPPRSLNPALPASVEALLLRALAKDPNARYHSAAAMAADIGQVADQLERAASGDELARRYQAGTQAFEAEQWAAAIDQLEHIVALDPGYQDAAELLELARAAWRHGQRAAWPFKASALKRPARSLARAGQQKELAGDLAGALADYEAARSATSHGRSRDRLAAAVANLTARVRREQRSLAGHPTRCPQCRRDVRPEWAGCPFCFAALNRVVLETAPGSGPEQPTAPADPIPAPRRIDPLPGPAAAPAAHQLSPAQAGQRCATRHVPGPGAPAPRGSQRVAASPPTPDLRVPARSAHLGRRSPALMALIIALGLLGGGSGMIWASQPTLAPTPAWPVAGRASITAPAATDTPTATETPSPTPTNTALPTTTPSELPTQPPASATPAPAAIANARLNLRSGPSTEYVILGRYAAGTSLTPRGRNSAGTWVQVESPDGQVGWMIAESLQINVALADLPLAAALPPPTPRPTLRPTPRPKPRPQLPTAAPEPPTPIPAPIAPLPEATASPTTEPTQMSEPTRQSKPTRAPKPEEPTTPPKPKEPPVPTKKPKK